MLQIAACREAEVVEDSEVVQEESASERLALTFAADNRAPSAINLSGVWTTARPMSGYDIQLTHKGERVEGKGYHWGCLGVLDPFTVEGSYKNGLLSLTVNRSGQVPEYRTYEILKTSEGLTLQRPSTEFRDVLYTAHHIHRLEQLP
ncbi:MAG: hypothetical protein EOP84_21750 [Verrucomicrobiaceae bacterium]|nr:MAG: hypothetical protein EOP84_21750 [Verrucomicrobiaceae bacterium]